MKKSLKIFIYIKNRFDNVWNEKYPFYWHIFNFLCGLLLAIIFVSMPDSRNSFSFGILAGLFFAIWLIGYLIMLALSYGIVRARNAWTKKRK